MSGTNQETETQTPDQEIAAKVAEATQPGGEVNTKPSPHELLALQLANSYLQALLDAVPELEAVTCHFAWNDGSSVADGALRARNNQLSLDATVKLASASMKLVEFTNHLLANALAKQQSGQVAKAEPDAESEAEAPPDTP